MTSEDDTRDNDTASGYRRLQEIDSTGLRTALVSLYLLGDDPYMRIQASNLSIIDHFITNLEYDALSKFVAHEFLPVPEIAFLSAQSQMWIFAVYELLRAWRERAKDVLKLSESGGLKTKIRGLEKELDYMHPGRKMRAEQLRKVSKNPSIIDTIKTDIRITHIPFMRIEHIRIALAKHEIPGKRKSIAFAPGYARINQECGSLEYEISRGRDILGKMSRRDIADELRAISDRSNPPTDEDLNSFDDFMKGPSIDPFSAQEP